jgi:CHAT domain-containing protein
MIAGVIAAAAALSLADCDAKVRADPDAPASYRCYLSAARGSGRFDDVARHLEGLLAIDADNHLARMYLAALYADRGQDRAETAYRSAIAGLVRRGDPASEATARVMLAGFLMRRARLDEAAGELDRARPLGAATGDAVVQTQVTVADGALAYRRNDYPRAYSLLVQAERDLPADAPFEVRSALHSNLGAVLWVTGRVRAAADHYRLQARLLREHGDLYEEASARINLTLLADVIGEPRATLANEALTIARRGGNVSVEARAHFYLSETSPQPARLEHAQRALSLSRSMRDAAGIQMALRAVASGSLDSDAAAAFDAIDEAIDLADRSGNLAESTRNWLVRSRMRWQVGPRIEAMRDSFRLLEAIEAERLSQPSGIDRARRADMWRQPYAELVARVLSTANDTPADLELAFTVMERGRARSLLDALAPSAASPALNHVRGVLQPDEALLEFQIWESSSMPNGIESASWVLVSDATATRAVALPAASAWGLSDAVRMFTGLVERRDGVEARAARSLFDTLMARAVAQLPASITRLIIVPDTTLYDFPFDLVRTPDGQPLGARYAVSIAPSATIWSHWRTLPARAPIAGALAIVDPRLPAGTAALAALPFAHREGRAVIASVPRARVVAGRNATEAAIKHTDLGGVGLVHIAAHAIVDNDRPDQSAVMLAASGNEDGSLRPSEIERMQMQGKVVVLSACQSANGAALRGEGLAGLADAFFRAGSHAVVASLWPLRDDEAALLFEDFYRRWRSGETLAAALASAKRARAAAGAPAAAWAGVIALGDGAVRLEADPDGDGVRTDVMVATAVCATLALVVVWVRRISRAGLP